MEEPPRAHVSLCSRECRERGEQPWVSRGVSRPPLSSWAGDDRAGLRAAVAGLDSRYLVSPGVVGDRASHSGHTPATGSRRTTPWCGSPALLCSSTPSAPGCVVAVPRLYNGLFWQGEDWLCKLLGGGGSHGCGAPLVGAGRSGCDPGLLSLSVSVRFARIRCINVYLYGMDVVISLT